jgi:hypothetical protein
MKKLSVVCAIVLLFGAGSALAQPNYQFADVGTKNFITEIDLLVGDQISLDLWLVDAGAPQNAGGAWIDFTASTAGLSYVSGGRCLTPDTEGCAGPWVPGGLFLNEAGGLVGTLTLECTAAGDVTVDLTTIPGVATWTPINDTDVVPDSLLIHQEAQTCIIDDECDDGLFCTGDETCVGGSCQDGPDPCTDDEAFCNGVESCDEGADQCVSSGDPCPPLLCDDVGDACVDCLVDGDCADDGIGCTDEICEAGTCVSTPNDANCPDDGVFCNGDEICDEALDCSSSGNPCQGTGGRERCDEERNRCETVPPGPTTCLNDKECSDGIFCNGAEVCVFSNVSGAESSLYTWSSSFAAATGNTGPGTCQESDGPSCPDDGEFCNGSESCDEDNAACLSTGDPCEGEDLVCDEENDECIEPPCSEDTDCDDALFCNGRETCAGGVCQPGGTPCPPPLECDEENDRCLIVPGPGTLSFRLIPQRYLRSHLTPLPLIMLIQGTDDATTFDQETTAVSFSGDAIVSPPLTVVSEKVILVFSVITRAGLGTNGTTEVEVRVITPEGEGTEIFTLILLPLL